LKQSRASKLWRVMAPRSASDTPARRSRGRNRRGMWACPAPPPRERCILRK